MQDEFTEANPSGDGRPTNSTLWAIVVAPLLLFVHLMAASVFGIAVSRLAPACAQLFQEWDMELPPMAIAAIGVSKLVVNYWHLFLFVLIFVDGPILFALQFLPDRHRWIRHLYHNGVILAFLWLIGFIVSAVSLPFMTIGYHLS